MLCAVVQGLAACADTAPLVAPVAMPSVPGAVTAPPSFSAALRTALPSVAGVYGMGASTVRPGQPPTALTRGDERAPWSTPFQPATVGGGFFIDAAGTLVTAAHVVANTRQVLVKSADQRVHVAELVAIDDEMDIALLRIKADSLPLAPLLGHSGASRPGDWVLAVGEPFGLHRSVVAGIVSGRARHFSEDSESFFVQSDLALNPGNSGGPLLNASGQIIGMNLRTIVGPFGTAGMSLSVPIETVLQIADELKRGEAAQRPRLGAGFEDVSAAAALDAGRSYANGALIHRIDTHGMARRLGLRIGDIVVGIDGHAVEDSADLARWLLAWRNKSPIALIVWREREYHQLKTVADASLD